MRLYKFVLVLLLGGFISNLRADVVINEIHYAPENKVSREEFIELYNAGDEEVDLSSWFFSSGIRFRFDEGEILGPGEYIVVAESVRIVEGRLGAERVVGPFEGRLSNERDRIVLRRPDGSIADQVSYQRGFPWPIAGGGGNYSIELLHPRLDNDLGGSWRLSSPEEASQSALVPAQSTWSYFKGVEEASSPREAWRSVEFDASGWLTGQTSIGYGEGHVETVLNDMRNGYTSVFLRKTFTVDDPDAVGSLELGVQFDDGFNAWINGVHVAGDHVASDSLAFDDTSDSTFETADFLEYDLPTPNYLRAGENVLAIQVHNASLGGSSDCFIDATLSAGSSGGGPTAGAVNALLTSSVPPRLRQVEHFPEQPVGDETVGVRLKAHDDDDIVSMILEYQVVDPGDYITLDDSRFETEWTAVDMNDAGNGLDQVAGDSIFTVAIPASVQEHRRLVRYRIRATDEAGNSVLVPYADDPQPNFAYFVYDGIPQWRGASRPGVTAVDTYSAEFMARLPVYHLIADRGDVRASQYSSGSRGRHFFGSMVYEGRVYDHMEFENRGEFSTYVSGKNKWRLHFQRAHEFRARNDFGRLYSETWRTMNLSALATPWVPTNRGMAGLGESVAFRLYGMAGVPSPTNNYFQFRVIDEAAEATSDQYRGDLWGLYMTIEHTDGAFLAERGLPDGNTYKIESGGGDKRNQGPTQTTSTSDYDAFRSGFNSSNSLSWWRSNVDLQDYFSFRAVNRAVNNMDLRDGWNHCQYHNPETGLWSVIPWDLDMLYMPVTHWSGVINLERCLSIAALGTEYRNRAREIQDLLLDDSQLSLVVDERLWVVSPPGESRTFADLDEAMWNYHPDTAGSHRGAFYRNPSNHSARGGSLTRTLISADHPGMAAWVKSFVLEEYGSQRLAQHARDTSIPDTPELNYIGSEGFPIDDLRFEVSDFDDPQGAGTFDGMAWRVAKITPRNQAQPGQPNEYEIDAVWESGEQSVFQAVAQIPSQFIAVDGTYRVRVRMKDNSERWSHWSAPVEFVAGASSVPFDQEAALRITEIQYNPGSDEDREFVEIYNAGASTVDLRAVRLVDGVDFDFASSDLTELAPGEFALVVKNRDVFEALYGADLNVAGEFEGRLGDGGEHVALSYGPNTTIVEFTYDDSWYPSTDGLGFSLSAVDVGISRDAWSDASAWMPSTEIGGTPGRLDGDPPPGGFQLPGDVNQDARLDLSDAVRLLLILFDPDVRDAPCDSERIDLGAAAVIADFDGDESVSLTDAVLVLQFLFRSGATHALGTDCLRVEGCPTVCGL